MRKFSSSIFVLSAVALFAAFAACNKMSKATYTPPASDTVIVKSNVVVVDSSKYKLISTAEELKNGTYVYSFQPSVTDLQHNGDFAPGITIIGVTGKGYLRKITSVTSTSETITVNTVLGKLEDVFTQGKIDFKAGTSGFRNGVNYTFDNLLLSQHNGTDVTLKSGTVSLTQDWDYSMHFSNGILTSFIADAKASTFTADVQVNIAGSTPSSVHASDTLDSYTRTDKVMVGKIPLMVSTEVYLIAVADGSTNGIQNHTYTIKNTTTLNANATYASGTWQHTLSTPTAIASLTGNTAKSPQANIACNIVPVINVRLCGEVISSNITLLNNSVNANLSTTTTDWDFSSRSVLQQQVNEYLALVSYSASELNHTWGVDSSVLATPYQVVKVGGDNQNGTIGNYLPQPIQVKVVDNNGNGQAGVTVRFKVLSGNGGTSYSSITSDANGLAAAYWQFGSGGSGQTLEVTAKNGSGANIMGTPMIFTAN